MFLQRWHIFLVVLVSAEIILFCVVKDNEILSINGFNLRANCAFDLYSYSLYILFIHVSMYYCISRCAICKNTRFAKAWLFVIVCSWYFDNVPEVFHGFSSFLHNDIAKRVVVFHLLNFPLVSFFFLQETHTLFYIFIFVCIYLLLNSNKLTFSIIFSFLWFYLVFNQVGFLNTVFRRYILWHGLHLVLSCKVHSYDPSLEKKKYKLLQFYKFSRLKYN